MHQEAKDSRSDPLRLDRRLAPNPAPDRHSSAQSARSRPRGRLDRDQTRVDHEEHVGKGGAKIGAVDGGMSGGLGGVEVFTAGTVELDRLLVRDIGEAEGEEHLGVAQDAGTSAKVALLVLFNLYRGSVLVPCGTDDVAV